MGCPKHRKYDREKARDVVAGMPRRRRVEKDLELGEGHFGAWQSPNCISTSILRCTMPHGTSAWATNYFNKVVTDGGQL